MTDDPRDWRVPGPSGRRVAPATRAALEEALTVAVTHAVEHMGDGGGFRCLGWRPRGGEEWVFRSLPSRPVPGIVIAQVLAGAGVACHVARARVDDRPGVVVTVYAPGVAVTLGRNVDDPEDEWSILHETGGVVQGQLDDHVLTALAVNVSAWN